MMDYDREADEQEKAQEAYAIELLSGFLPAFEDESIEKQIALGMDYLDTVLEHTNDSWNHGYVIAYFESLEEK